jgi:ABC-2 type transport system permease protein
MIAGLRAELFKLRRRSAVWLIGAVWLVLTLVFGYLFPVLSDGGETTGPTGGSPAEADPIAQALPAELVSAAVSGFPMFAGALALILGVLVMGSEYGWHTVKVMFTAGPTRRAVLAGKVTALVFVMFVIVLATFAVDALAALLVAALQDSPVSWPPVGELVTGFLAGWLIVVMWAIFGMFLGVLVRGTTLAVGLGLVWTLAVETLLRLFASAVGFLDAGQRLFPGTNAGALAAAVGVPPQGSPGGTPGVTDVVSGTQAAIVLGAYVVAFTVAAMIVLDRRDVS